MIKSNVHRPKRTVQVGGLIQQELSDLLLRKIKDPRLEMVTITGVEVSPDLKLARVFFSRYGHPEATRRTVEGLQRAAGFLRRELGERMKLRYVPELEFIHDTSYEYGDRIEALLKTIRTGRRIADDLPGAETNGIRSARPPVFPLGRHSGSQQASGSDFQPGASAAEASLRSSKNGLSGNPGSVGHRRVAGLCGVGHQIDPLPSPRAQAVSGGN